MYSWKGFLLSNENRSEFSLLTSLPGTELKTKNLPSKINVKLIDEFEIDGDFVESQAFAFLAIRRCIKLPITFPNTTNCSKPSIGGEIIDD